jgi:hypothetical protein
LHLRTAGLFSSGTANTNNALTRIVDLEMMADKVSVGFLQKNVTSRGAHPVE